MNNPESVNKALLAHLCRCTGWQTIHEAAEIVAGTRVVDRDAVRDLSAASRRADMEGHSHQTVHPRIALGDGGFAEDVAPDDALVAVLNAAGDWVLGPDVASARRAAGSVQGRKSTVPVTWPVEIDTSHREAGNFVRTLMTTWVEPAYLEPDAVWCVPGGEPVGPLVNGGSFGGKSDPRVVDDVKATARRLADEHSRAVRVVLSREDIVRRGPKRPPMALGVRADGSGTMWAVRTPGLRERMAKVAPDWEVIEVDVPGPPTSTYLRAAGWAEVAVLRSSVREPVVMSPAGSRSGSPDSSHDSPRGDHVVAPNGAEAWARVDVIDGVVNGTAEPGSTRERIVVRVRCGRPLDDVVLRSYCIGAAHMAIGWVRSEGIAVDAHGTPVDLTMRSFGVLRAMDTPEIVVEIDDPDFDIPDRDIPDRDIPDRENPDRELTTDHDSVNGSDAVFAAVAAAVWRHDGFPPAWPSRR